MSRTENAVDLKAVLILRDTVAAQSLLLEDVYFLLSEEKPTKKPAYHFNVLRETSYVSPTSKVYLQSDFIGQCF